MRRDRHGSASSLLIDKLDARSNTAAAIADCVARTIEHGGTAVLPTDTAYAFACDPHQAAAVARVYAATHRPISEPLTLLFATVAELLEYVDGHPLATLAARAFMPGPLTVIVRRPRFVPASISGGGDTIWLRVPDHRMCVSVLEACGPLAAGDGGPRWQSAADVFLDAGPMPVGREATVLDLSGSDATLVHEGAISHAALEAQLGTIICGSAATC